MPVSELEFRNALSRFASGVSVVTTKDADGKFQGITVSAFSSVSLDPPLILVCIEKTTASHFAVELSKTFVVNVLNSAQTEISIRFASPVSDKFDRVDFRLGIDEIPVITGCLANLECRLAEAFDVGDHTIFIGRVENAFITDGDPLLYFRSDYRLIGDTAITPIRSRE